MNYEAVPLYPFISLVCLQLRDAAQVKSPSHVRGDMVQCFTLHAFYHQTSVTQILKFHERVISALKFELKGERSQILVVNFCE